MALAAAMLPGASAAAAADFELHRISGTPYTVNALCQSDGLDGEVSLGVDPHTGRMVAGWVQDAEGLSNPALATLVDVTATSSNGVDWTAAEAPPGVMLCDQPPGPNVVATDPSVSVGPDGRWYLGRLGEVAAPVGGVPGPSGIYVNTSTTGSEWSYPPVAMSDNLHDDFDTVIADPEIAGRAYVTWTNFIDDGGDPERSRILFSRTTDGGASFSQPVTVHQAPSGSVDDAARIVVLGDGAVLAIFAELTPETFTSGEGPFTLYSSRSTDGGDTWSAPVEVSSGTYSNVVDPQTGEVYQAYCCLPSLAAGPGDSAHVVWNTNSSSDQGAIHLASTADGGRSWTVAPPLERSAQTFVPTVAATPRTIAVTWYDFAGEQPAGQARPTTLWVARSKDAGASWTLDRLAGPFDIATATPPGQANYLGDTQGLVAVSGGFEAAFTAATPVAVNGPTDIFRAFIADLPADPLPADPLPPPPLPPPPQQARPCGNVIQGTPNADHLLGTRRSDLIRGLGGRDLVNGRRGRDCLYGGPGADRLRGGKGKDLLSSGPGRDVVRTRDPAIDRVRCGPGRDIVFASARDRVAGNCEIVRRR